MEGRHRDVTSGQPPEGHTQGLVSVEEANLLKYPSQIYPHFNNQELTLGDLHGNALKLLYFLIQHGVVDWPEGKQQLYSKLAAIYSTYPLQKEDVEFFVNAISKLEIKNKNAIRLIGDELADRGMSDLFTLLILQKLDKEKVPFSILTSNHGFEFYIKYREFKATQGDFVLNEDAFKSVALGDEQGRSMFNMGQLVQSGIIKADDFFSLYERVCLPQYKLIDYVLDEQNKTFTFFMHGVSGLKTIEGVAQAFGVQYKGETVADLARTIDQINQKFVEQSKKGSLNLDLFEPHFKSLYDQNHVEMTYPCARLIWNREYPVDKLTHKDSMPAKLDGYSLRYVHGHNGPVAVAEELQGHVFNIDRKNLLGRPGRDEAPYDIFTQTIPQPALKEEKTIKKESADVTSPVNKKFVKNLLDVFAQMDSICKQMDAELDRLIIERKKQLAEKQVQSVVKHNSLYESPSALFHEAPAKETALKQVQNTTKEQNKIKTQEKVQDQRQNLSTVRNQNRIKGH